MGRSQETFHKKEVRNKKEKKRKEKEARRLAKKEQDTSGALDDMIAYVDEYGNITSTPPDPDKKEEVKAENIQINIPKQEDAEDDDPVRTGTVSFFNHSKGYGFIKDSVTGESIFAHVNNTTEELNEGNQVSFEIEMGPKGPNAIKIQIKRD